MQQDAAFTSTYDPTLLSHCPSFGFQTTRSHAYEETTERYKDSAWKIASYIPILGAFAVIPLSNQPHSSVQREYRQIKNRKLIRECLSTTKACNKELSKEWLQQQKENLLRSAESDSFSFFLRLSLLSKNLENVKRYIDISPIAPFNEQTVQEKRLYWQTQKQPEKVEACDRLLTLLEEHKRIADEENTKLNFLKIHYPGVDNLSIDSDDINGMELGFCPKHGLRMLLSLLGVGVVVLPVIDLLVTIHNEYRANPQDMYDSAVMINFAQTNA